MPLLQHFLQKEVGKHDDEQNSKNCHLWDYHSNISPISIIGPGRYPGQQLNHGSADRPWPLCHHEDWLTCSGWPPLTCLLTARLGTFVWCPGDKKHAGNCQVSGCHCQINTRLSHRRDLGGFILTLKQWWHSKKGACPKQGQGFKRMSKAGE